MTLERVGLPDDLVGRLEGKSSLGRLGLIIHSTAGYIDAGFSGTITLELSNVAKLPIPLYPGMFIGQISFLTLTTPVDRPYGSPGLGSKYQDQEHPTGEQGAPGLQDRATAGKALGIRRRQTGKGRVRCQATVTVYGPDFLSSGSASQD